MTEIPEKKTITVIVVIGILLSICCRLVFVPYTHVVVGVSSLPIRFH